LQAGQFLREESWKRMITILYRITIIEYGLIWSFLWLGKIYFDFHVASFLPQFFLLLVLYEYDLM
jgi:hypothetical protein